LKGDGAVDEEEEGSDNPDAGDPFNPEENKDTSAGVDTGQDRSSTESKKLDLEFSIDRYFAKLGADFDEGGALGAYS